MTDLGFDKSLPRTSGTAARTSLWAARQDKALPTPSRPLGDADGTYKQFSVEELDSQEQEGKAKMGFAKMQIPAETKEMHLLNDGDFQMKDEPGRRCGLPPRRSGEPDDPRAMEDSLVLGGADGLETGSIASADVMPATGASLTEGSLVGGSNDSKNEYKPDADFVQDPAEETKASEKAKIGSKKTAPPRATPGQDKGSKDVSEKAAQLGLYQ